MSSPPNQNQSHPGPRPCSSPVGAARHRSRGRRAQALAGWLALWLPAALLWGALAPAVDAAHPHYERLLQEGRFALERGEPEEAAHALRLACFGLLEEPPVLTQCLVRLGLAQSTMEDTQAFLDTFRRIVEVEERFRGYSDAGLPAEVRADFEESVLAHVPEGVLDDAGVFAELVAEDDPAPETTVPSSPLEEPPTPRADAGADDEAEDGVRADEGLSPQDRERLDRARELMAEARNRSELDEPFRLAQEVAESRPGSREAQHLTAVIAYRGARWADAVRYFRRGGDPEEDHPEMLFYMAVALYESGESEAAAEVLRRSLPHLEPTPFVQSYRSKILEQQSTSSQPVPRLRVSDRLAAGDRAQKGVQR